MKAGLIELPGLSARDLREIAPLALFLIAVVLLRDAGMPAGSPVGAWTVLCLSAAIWGATSLVHAIVNPQTRVLPPLGAALLVLGVTLVSGVTRGRPPDVWVGPAINLSSLALAHGLIFRLASPRRWAALLWTLTGLALALSVSATLELVLLGGEPQHHGAPIATLGRPDHLGIALVLLLPAILTCARGPRRRQGVLGIAGFALIVIAWTGSYLALMGASALLGSVVALGRSERGDAGSRRAPWMLLIALLLGLISRPWVIELTSRGPLPETLSLSTQWDARQHLLARGAEAAMAQPWFGAGVGQWPWAFSEAQARHFRTDPLTIDRYVQPTLLENTPLELLLEHGLIGLLLLGGVLWLGWRLVRGMSPASRAPLPLFALSGLALFGLFSLGTSTLASPTLATLGVVYLACLRDQAPPLTAPPWLQRVIGVGAVGLLMLGSVLVLQRHLSERLHASALDALDADAPAAAARDLEAAASHAPSAAVAYARGTLAASRGALRDAANAYAEALRRTPSAAAHRRHGATLCLLGERRAGASALIFAEHLQPGHPETTRALARCRPHKTPPDER